MVKILPLHRWTDALLAEGEGARLSVRQSRAPDSLIVPLGIGPYNGRTLTEFDCTRCFSPSYPPGSRSGTPPGVFPSRIARALSRSASSRVMKDLYGQSVLAPCRQA